MLNFGRVFSEMSSLIFVSYMLYLHLGIFRKSKKAQIGISFTVMITIQRGTQVITTTSFRHLYDKAHKLSFTSIQ
jgi:hypothetical protein